MERILGKEDRKFWMGLSVILIFLFHLQLFTSWLVTYPFWLKILLRPLDHMWIGVDVFVFLSAYGLCHSFTRNGVVTFYWNRLKRIMPAYFLFAITLFVFYQRGHSLDSLCGQWLCQISGLSNFYRFDAEIEWFTPALILLYLLFPFGYKICKKIYNYPLMVYIFVLLAIISVKYLSSFATELMVSRIPIALVAIFTYFYIQDKKERLLVQLFLFFALCFLLTEKYNIDASCIVPLLLFAFNGIIVKGRLYQLFTFLGSYSFEIYLAQVIATKYFLLYESYDICYLVVGSVIITVILTYLFVTIQKKANFLLKR